MNTNANLTAIKECTAWIRARRIIYTTLRRYTEMIDYNAEEMAAKLAKAEAENREHDRWWAWVRREAEDVCVIVGDRQYDLRTWLDTYDCPAPDAAGEADR